MGALSLWHWLIVLLVVVLVFGTKRLKNVGKDLGEAVKGFKDGVRDEDAKPPAQLSERPADDIPRRADASADADAAAAAKRNDSSTNDDHSPR